jgi:hypothetical protein
MSNDFWEGYVPEPTRPAPMTKDKALDLALEALEQYTNVVTSVNDPDSWETVVDGGKPARDAITAINQSRLAPVQDVDWKDMYEKEKRRSEMWVAKYEKDIGPLEYAMPVVAPVQEPVACNTGVPPLYPEMKDGETISVEYTAPPAAQRQWVGLTDEERQDLWRDVVKWGDPSHDDVDLMKAIEAKLKERNV